MNDRSPSAKLTSGPIGSTLVRLSAPMLVGILGMMAFNVVDTYFVGQLGTKALAAMTLTFPVVMVIGTFTLGLGVGAMALISQGIGAGDQGQIRRCTTDALMLACVCVAILMVIGLATLEPLFRALGATDELMPFVKKYMSIWYLGIAFYVVPIVGNNIIRATGDTVTPSVVMLLGVVINGVLDPILIFGFGPIEPMGITGAAVATVLARGLTLLVALWVLKFKLNMLGPLWPGLGELVGSWKMLLRMGLPIAVSNAIIPVALGVITRIVSQFGPESVAGFGVATRIEGFGLALIYALSTGVSPFVGQNFGAGRMDRIAKGLSYAQRFALAWGVLLLLTFLLTGRYLAARFNPDPQVIQSACLYLWVVPISLGLRSIHLIIWTSLNVLGRPYDALFIEFLLAVGLWIPLAYAGVYLADLGGLYGGLSIANIIAGITAHLWISRVLAKTHPKPPEQQPT